MHTSKPGDTRAWLGQWGRGGTAGIKSLSGKEVMEGEPDKGASLERDFCAKLWRPGIPWEKLQCLIMEREMLLPPPVLAAGEG